MGWKTVMKQQKLVEKMTIEEKAAILSGKTVWQTREIDRLSIPSIFLSDGPHGIRKQAGAGDHLGLNASLNATCFPTAATIANSWNQDLGEEIGQALGEEAASMDVNILLGPGLNIKRSPLCGRNFEYFSEDPYLTGICACEITKGVQEKHSVLVCAKHFAVNEQETFRRGSNKRNVDAVDSILTERAARELYLKPFEMLVRNAEIACIMTSFNKINGTFAGGSKDLCTHILREEWGFDGAVVTDWGGMDVVVDGADAIAAGNDIIMPGGPPVIQQILEGLKDNRVTREEMEKAVSHLMTMLRRVQRFDR